jgi:hypothetical protein
MKKEKDKLGNRGRAEESGWGKLSYREERQAVRFDLAEFESFETRRQEDCASGEGRKCGRRVFRIWRRDPVVDQFGCDRRQRLRSADSEPRAVGRAVPRRLRFKRKEDCQQAKSDNERNAPGKQGIGGPT